jgi:hypothetical protein
MANAFMCRLFWATVAARAQVLVGLRRTVSANGVDFGGGFPGRRAGRGAGRATGGRKADVAGAVIAEMAVDLFQGAGQIAVALAVDDIEAFAGVGVEEAHAILGQRGPNRRGRVDGEKHQERQGGQNRPESRQGREWHVGLPFRIAHWLPYLPRRRED